MRWMRRLGRWVHGWASRPVVIPGWMLTGKYIGLTVLGVAMFFSVSPSLVLTIGDTLSRVWSVLVILAGIVGAWASTSEERERVERWAASVLALAMIVFAVSPVLAILTEQDWERAAFSVALLILTGLPTSRAVYLLGRTGVDPHAHPVDIVQDDLDA